MCEGSEHEVSRDDGRRIVEIGMLAEGLESCCFCQQPIQLKNVVDEKMIWGWQVYSTSILLSPLLPLRFSILLKHFIPVRNKRCYVKTPLDSSSAPVSYTHLTLPTKLEV